MTIALRLLALAGFAYLAVLALFFALQSRLIYPAPQEAARLTPGYSEITLETDDGLALRSFYRKAAQGMPTVVYFHGNGGTLSGASVSNAALAQAGLGVLLVEYRGYGGNPGEPSEEGFYRDADAALRWLKTQAIVPSRLFVIGNSIGGGSAAYAAQSLLEKGTAPAGLILIAPFTSLPDAGADQLWWLPVHAFMKDTFPNHERLAKLSDVPALIQHGTRDTVINDSHGRVLASIHQGSEFQSYEGSGHGLSFEQRSQEARLRWIQAMSDAKRAQGGLPEG